MAIHLSSISATFFTNVLSRLGVKPPPPDGFDLINTVQPVSIVDVDVPITAIASPPLLNTPFTAGETTAPAANTRLADTGATLPAGNYQAFIMASADEGAFMRLRRRNAADNADIWIQRFCLTNTALPLVLHLFVTMQVNERLVLENASGANAGKVYNATIWLVPG